MWYSAEEKERKSVRGEREREKEREQSEEMNGWLSVREGEHTIRVCVKVKVGVHAGHNAFVFD